MKNDSDLKHFGIERMQAGEDIITINGVRYDGNLFRDLGAALPVGELFRMVKRDDGVIYIERCSQLRSLVI